MPVEEQGSAQPGVGQLTARNVPSREEFLRLLDLEIADARTAGEVGGWTQWALAGALATVVALVAAIWEVGKVRVDTAAAIFVITLLIYGLIRDLPRFGSRSWPRSNELRFLVRRHFTDGRGARAAVSAVSLFAFLVVWYLGDRASDRTFRIAVYLYFAFYPIGVFVVLAGSSLDLPMPSHTAQNSKTKIVFKLTDWVLRGLGLLALFGFSRKLAFVPSGNSLVDTRIGVLAAVGLFLLIELVARGAPHAALVTDLTETRRELVLGHRDLASAVQRFEELTLGILAGRILDEDITAASAEFDDAEATFKDVELALARDIREIDALAATEVNSPEESAQLDACFDSMDKAQAQIIRGRVEFNRHMTRGRRHTRRAVFRATIGSRADPRAGPPIQESLRLLEERSNKLEREANDYVQKLDAHGAKLDVLRTRLKARGEARKARVGTSAS